MKKTLANLLWFLVAVAGAGAYATLAFHRGEPLNSAYILVAALCSYAVGYRFYSKWLAALKRMQRVWQVFELPMQATSAKALGRRGG
jgi:hypothetical protein